MLSIRRTSSSTNDRSSTSSAPSPSSGSFARLFLGAILHPTPFTRGCVLRRTTAARSRTRRTDVVTRWSFTAVRRSFHARPSSVFVVVSLSDQQTSPGRSCRLWRRWRRRGVHDVYVCIIIGRQWQFCLDEKIAIGWLQALSSIRKECITVICREPHSQRNTRIY